jgi:hypothetical protein
MITRRIVSVVALGLLLAACGGGEPEPQAPPKAEPSVPAGRPLDAGQIKALAALFPDNPLTGGQVAPRSYRWVNEQVAIFVQFDKPNPDEATALRYIGVSVKGVYCKEAQPDAEKGSFTHFHRLKAVDYGDGHAGRPGEPGYWLSWVAVHAFDQRDRAVKPGVDYAFSPTEPPACSGNVPKADFAAPGARPLSKPDIQTLASAFGDNPLTGGQVAPRLYRWVNEDAQIFLQFDLFVYFLRHPGQVLSRSALLQAVWGYDAVDPNTVEQHVAHLRRKLGEPRVIRTVWGVGYALRAEP